MAYINIHNIIHMLARIDMACQMNGHEVSNEYKDVNHVSKSRIKSIQDLKKWY